MCIECFMQSRTEATVRRRAERNLSSAELRTFSKSTSIKKGNTFQILPFEVDLTICQLWKTLWENFLPLSSLSPPAYISIFVSRWNIYIQMAAVPKEIFSSTIECIIGGKWIVDSRVPDRVIMSYYSGMDWLRGVLGSSWGGKSSKDVGKLM